jgi:DoxX-like family
MAEATMGARMVANDLARVSTGRLWTGRAIAGLIALFCLFDAAMKFVQPKPVADAFVRTGWPLHLSVTLGVLLMTSTVLYLIPRTAILGAILLTGYLGGAVATNLRLENPLFSYTLFPVYFGVLVWVSLWLRDPKLQELVPLRSNG